MARRLTDEERAVSEIIRRYRKTRLRKFENFWGVTINEDADGTSAVSPFLSNPERTLEENLAALESWLNTYGAHKTKVGGRGKGRKPPKTKRTLCISAEDDAKLKALKARTGKGASHLFSAMVRYCNDTAPEEFLNATEKPISDKVAYILEHFSKDDICKAYARLQDLMGKPSASLTNPKLSRTK